jgi:hypothetical protein
MERIHRIEAPDPTAMNIRIVMDAGLPLNEIGASWTRSAVSEA